VAWLRGLGLEQYAQLFRDNDIDGEILCVMTAEDLKELGISSFGHRRRLLNAITVERQQSREQCRHPDDAGTDALQDLRLGTYAEREQHDSENKEPDDETGVAALAQGET
jgi:hypothetical protein